MQMPYIHWESHLARINLSKMISEVKEEAIKPSRTQKGKTPLWPNDGGSETLPQAAVNDAGNEAHAQKKQSKGPTLDTPENEEDYRELLRRYLYKRRPVHLRRTLDQYYYSYLADTNDRDGDQVVMRHFNEEKKSLNLEADSKYQKLLDEKKSLKEFEKQPIPKPETMDEELPGQGETESTPDSASLRRLSESSTQVGEADAVDTESSVSPPKASTWEHLVNRVKAPWKRKELKEVDSKLHKIDQVLYYDDNSPVLMIDQLWLWIIDKGKI